jgi:hypothetical protein
LEGSRDFDNDRILPGPLLQVSIIKCDGLCSTSVRPKTRVHNAYRPGHRLVFTLSFDTHGQF